MTGGLDDYTVEEVARAWLVKMRGAQAGHSDMTRDDREALHREFTEWLSASPAHRTAYERISQRLDEAAILKSSAKYGTDRDGLMRAPLRRRWILWGGTATAAVLLFLAFAAGGAPLAIPLEVGSRAIAAEPLVTRRGEIRRFHLSDGSVATLDTDSRLDVSITPRARHIRILRGRARFEVRTDPRPFKVEAGGAMVTSRQGKFDIGIDRDGAGQITLLSGQADISAATSAGASTQPIEASEGLVYTIEDRSVRPVPGAQANVTHDWPEGWADYRSISLAELVAEANRYARTPIVIDDPAAAKIMLTGRFRISETEAFANRIAALLGLVAVRRSGKIHLASG